jgi:aspartate-semialdehyde dehydrogenase
MRQQAGVLLALVAGYAHGFSVGPVSTATAQPQRTHHRWPTALTAAPLRAAVHHQPPVARGGLPEMMASEPLKVGVVGVTGAVGQEIIEVLGNRGFPVSELKLFASARSAGKPMKTPFGELTIEEFTLESARECDVVFLAVSGDFAEEWVDKISENDGPLVIDNSSAFRYDPTVPLVVTEINAEAAKKSKRRVIANPNCTTAIALMALAPIHKEFGIKRCIMSTYQAASGAGDPGMKELEEGSAAIANGKEATNEVFAHRLPFNVIPHIDKFLEDDYTKEERKVTWEMRKIMDLPDLPVSCTCVRIPTLRAHAESITLETEKPVDIAAAIAALEAAPGVSVTDDVANNVYPMPITATKKYDVEVGRLRKNDVFGDKGLDLFVCGDQLLRGAALNAVLIAEAVC